MAHPTATTTGQLALDVLRQQRDAFLAHAPGARSGDDPLHVHQMRVATRRLRAAVRVFEDVLPQDAAALGQELKWMAERLGQVRDLDVQLKHARERGVELDIARGLTPYVAWLEARRQRAHRGLVGAFGDPRYEQLIEHLSRTTYDWQAPADNDANILDDAPRRLRGVWRKLRKAASDLGANPSAEALHRMRIRAKRVRYAVEFHAEIYGEPARAFAKRVVDLQDTLGEHQDAVVCHHFVDAALAEAAGGWSDQTVLALGRLIQRDAARGSELRATVGEVYARVGGKAWHRARRALAAAG